MCNIQDLDLGKVDMQELAAKLKEPLSLLKLKISQVSASLTVLSGFLSAGRWQDARERISSAQIALREIEAEMSSGKFEVPPEMAEEVAALKGRLVKVNINEAIESRKRLMQTAFDI